jgi:hypothetical protein
MLSQSHWSIVMNKLIKSLRIAAATLLLIALAACGNSTPSQSDAKAAIQARLGDCDDIKITDITKLNGIPVDENDYNVEVKYTIEFTPYGHLKRALDHGNKNVFVLLANVRADCPNISGSMLGTISQTALGTEDIAMQKTENGWQEVH